MLFAVRMQLRCRRRRDETFAGQYIIILAVKKIKEKKMWKIIILLSSRFIRSEYLTYFLMIANDTNTHISLHVSSYIHTQNNLITVRI